MWQLASFGPCWLGGAYLRELIRRCLDCATVIRESRRNRSLSLLRSLAGRCLIVAFCLRPIRIRSIVINLFRNCCLAPFTHPRTAEVSGVSQVH
jgi:hypothetical protein